MPLPTKVSNRLAVFKVLNRHPDGLSSAKLREKIGMADSNGQLGVLLRGEQSVGRIVTNVDEDQNGRDVLLYVLTARGKKALASGLVDSDARRLGLVAAGRGNK